MGKEMKQMQPAKEKLHTLYKIYEKPMYHIAYAILHHTQQTEDAVSEGFAGVDRQSAQDRRSGESADQAVHDTIIRSTAISQYREKRPGIRPAFSVGR